MEDKRQIYKEAYKKIETKRIGRRIIEVEKTFKDKV